MKRSVAVSLGLFLAASAFAQGNRGSIGGTISGPDGEVVAGARVQVKNVSSGAVSEAESSRAGTYEVSNLVPGVYELSVPVIGWPFGRQMGGRHAGHRHSRLECQELASGWSAAHGDAARHRALSPDRLCTSRDRRDVRGSGCVEQAMEPAHHLDSRSRRGTHRIRMHGK